MEPLTPEVLRSVERIYEFLKQGADFSHLPVQADDCAVGPARVRSV